VASAKKQLSAAEPAKCLKSLPAVTEEAGKSRKIPENSGKCRKKPEEIRQRSRQIPLFCGVHVLSRLCTAHSVLFRRMGFHGIQNVIVTN